MTFWHMDYVPNLCISYLEASYESISTWIYTIDGFIFSWDILFNDIKSIWHWLYYIVHGSSYKVFKMNLLDFKSSKICWILTNVHILGLKIIMHYMHMYQSYNS